MKIPGKSAWYRSLLARYRKIDTFGLRIGLAMMLSGLFFLVVATIGAYLNARHIASTKEYEAVEYELTRQIRQATQILTTFVENSQQLANNDVVSSMLVDSEGRDRHMAPFLQLLRSSVRRQFDPQETGLRNVRFDILDHNGEVLASSEPLLRSYANAAWIKSVMAGAPQAAFEAASNELLVAYPIIFPGTGQPEGMVVGRADIAQLMGLEGNRVINDSRWLIGSAKDIATLRENDSNQVFSDEIVLAEPLNGFGWQAALAFPKSKVRDEALSLLWPYLIALLISMPLLALTGHFIGRRLALPLEKLTLLAGGLSSENLEMLPVGEGIMDTGAREVVLLAESLREAVKRIHATAASMQLANAAMDSASEGIVIVDAQDGNLPIIYANDAFERITGYRREEIYGKNCRFLHGRDPDQPALDTLRQAIRAGEMCEVVLRNYTKDGRPFWNNLSIAPLRDKSGTLTHFVGIQNDVSEQREAEQSVRELQKMEAIGQLTGGLAHDFNNLLGVVVGNLDLIEERLPAADEPLRRRFETARDAALRGAEVTRSLLAVARRQPLEVAEHDVNSLLVEMMPLMRASAGSAVHVETQLDVGPLTAQLDAGGLSNALLNLVINARDAMQEQAREQRLVVSTHIEQVTQEGATDLISGEYVVLVVRDNGRGMTPEIRAQVFDPFFTTKERGKGTGLGLSMVRGYAEQLGGTVRIESELGRGTAVSIFLPRYTPPQAAESVAAKLVALDAPGDSVVAQQSSGVIVEDASSKSSKRVLVVDDELGLCDLASAWLESLGYVTTSAQSPVEALACLEKNHYDVLFTDVVMPGSMDGVELATWARQHYPHLRVLLTSGYARSVVDTLDLPGALLNKPYRKKDLARAFEQLWTH